MGVMPFLDSKVLLWTAAAIGKMGILLFTNTSMINHVIDMHLKYTGFNLKTAAIALEH